MNQVMGADQEAMAVLSAMAALAHRDYGATRVDRESMQARIERGFWVFQAPIGYRYEKCRQGGKRLVPDEPAVSVIREALEGYAAGRFETQVEVKRFLESQPLYHRGKDGLVHPSRVTELLERVVYAGYVEEPMWKVSLREGQHEGLISCQTYLRNQERLRKGSRTPARRDINADFPLRGYVLCDECHSRRWLSMPGASGRIRPSTSKRVWSGSWPILINRSTFWRIASLKVRVVRRSRPMNSRLRHWKNKSWRCGIGR
ncbi:hypothetical protein [Rhodospirillum sp. A1_3_36]|uniref:hypothetical protein n=1 Tax=Rhodospirillum sp. A1_3_36 TaxID=3391666 RepID=UPI0039A454C6